MDCASRYAFFSSSDIPDKNPEVNTNVIEINLNCLRNESSIATGDPLLCKNCECLLNSSSVLIRSDAGVLWECEFCNHKNNILIENEEIPQQLEVTYFLEQELEAENQREISQIDTNDNTAIVFCIDVSGSMAIKKQIPGRLQLRTSNTQNTNKEDFTSVSRLECMQAAVESQIQNLLNTSPSKKVGLVTFSNNVEVLGDCTNSLKVPSIILDRFDELMNFSQSKKGLFLNENIGSSSVKITEKLMKLRASGGTALGPALLYSVVLASDGGRGSKVVICTDGLANEGVGSLDRNSDQNSFYKEIASIATELGISVSVISIEGQECRLESLALVTEETGGSIVKVAPETLTTEFANVMADDVIATQVSVQVFLHKTVKFVKEPAEVLSLNDSRMHKFIGNATPSSAFSFQYALKSNEEIAALGINKNDISSIPFQAVFRYVTLNGKKRMRAITKVQPVTFSRENIEENVDIDILARCGRRRAVQLAEEGKLEEAKNDAIEWNNLMKTEIKGPESLAKQMVFENDVKEITKNIDHQLIKEKTEGVEFHGLPQADSKKRRQNYGDTFVVGMSMMKKKK